MSNGGSDQVGKAESLNQIVRGFCVVILLVSFCAAFLWGVYQNQDKPVIDGVAFVGALTLALTWFFKSRDEQQRRSDIAAQAASTAPPTPSAIP